MIVLPQDWLERWKGEDVFERLFSLQGRVYKDKDGRRTLRFSLEGQGFFAKLHTGVGWKEIIKEILQLRMPVLGAQNEWRAIKRLDGAGIQTTPLVGYGRRGLNPARIQSFVVTRELANTVSLETFCRDWAESPPPYELKKALITEVARITRTLHENGMNHRDLYICHFLLDISEGEKDVQPAGNVYLVDLHRVQVRERVPMRWIVKDIASLWFSSMDLGLTRRDLLRFVREYRNVPLKRTLKEEKSFWRRVRKRGEALYRKYQRKYADSC